MHFSFSSMLELLLTCPAELPAMTKVERAVREMQMSFNVKICLVRVWGQFYIGPESVLIHFASHWLHWMQYTSWCCQVKALVQGLLCNFGRKNCHLVFICAMPMLTGTQKSFSTGSYYAKTSTGWLLCTQIQCFKSGAFFQHFKCSPQGCIWPLPSLFRYSGWEERGILSIPLHVSEHKSRRHLSDPTLAGDNQACIRLKPFRRWCPDMFSMTWELCTTENIFWPQTKFGVACI